MKTHHLSALLFVIIILTQYKVNAQINVNYQTCTSAAWSPTSGQNYIRSRMFKSGGVTPGNINVSRTTCEVNQEVQYFDGLGRPLQKITIQGSPLFKDIVQPYAYDNFGREVTKYLPYTDVSGTANGSLKANALTTGQGLNAFYSSPPSGVKSISHPLSASILEPSPLDRILEQGAPGQVWQPASSRTTTGGRTVATEYGSNITGDNVREWTVTGSVASGGTFYAVNKLFKTTTKDENWGSGKSGTIEEFKNFDGRVVLKKVWETESVSLSTYYVYDDFGNLRFVIPPAVTVTYFQESDVVFENFIYGYHYDSKNRLIEKKIPGKGWEYLVYNNLDQVVMTQDAVQRGKTTQEWTVTKYDMFGRVVITGIFAHNGSMANTSYRASMQTNVDGQSSQWENKTSSGDGYTTNLTYPGTALNTILSVIYYDDYTAPSMPYNFSTTYSNMTRGLLTASKTLVLGTTSSYLWAVNYYDNEERVVKTYKQHYQSGAPSVNNYDEITNTYNFAGELTASTRLHKIGATTTTVATRYQYDHMGRKKAVFEKINAGNEVVLSKLDYNEIGQLTQKNLHSTNGTTFTQNTKYGYNERGWLKRNISNEFSMKLGYDTLTNAQYNGNISTQEWGSTFANKFLYSYDKLNRLTNGTSSGTAMSEVLTYDVMGNISTLNRDGGGLGTYRYIGNRLDSISGGPLLTSKFYYDLNGNATKDGRTGVTLGYNILNLPSSATKTGLNLSYTYDASGNKLRKINSTSGVTSHYINGIEYKGNVIDIIHTEEGVVRNISGTFSYEYTLKDHLGNARYTFDISGGVLRRIQQQDYYPFGKIKESGQYVFGEKNKYLYNSKELQEELGQLDYGARFYDPVIGRWNVIDPLAEKFFGVNPYNYGDNNPINNVDPDGMETYYGAQAGFMFSMFRSQSSAESDSGGPDDPKKKKSKPKGYFQTFYQQLSKMDPLGNTGRTWRGWLSSESTLGSDLWQGVSNTYWGVASLTSTDTYINWFEGVTGYWSLTSEERAKGDAIALSQMIEGGATYAPFAMVGKGAGLKQVNPFGLNQGYGLFGEKGLNIGNYEIGAFYGNRSSPDVGGTIFSIKQNQTGGNMLRWDYGRRHKTQNNSLHSTFRFNIGNNTYGSSAQYPWSAPFQYWKYKKQ